MAIILITYRDQLAVFAQSPNGLSISLISAFITIAMAIISFYIYIQPSINSNPDGLDNYGAKKRGRRIPRVFLSYAHEDLAAAKMLYNDLINSSVSAWMASESIIPGQNWPREIKRSIRSSDYFLAIISKNSINKKGFVERELAEALDLLDEFPKQDIFIIQVRLDESKPTNEKLYSLQWVDMFPSWEDGLARILSAIKVHEDPNGFLNYVTKKVKLNYFEYLSSIERIYNFINTLFKGVLTNNKLRYLFIIFILLISIMIIYAISSNLRQDVSFDETYFGLYLKLENPSVTPEKIDFIPNEIRNRIVPISKNNFGSNSFNYSIDSSSNNVVLYVVFPNSNTPLGPIRPNLTLPQSGGLYKFYWTNISLGFTDIGDGKYWFVADNYYKSPMIYGPKIITYIHAADNYSNFNATADKIEENYRVTLNSFEDRIIELIFYRDRKNMNTIGETKLYEANSGLETFVWNIAWTRSDYLPNYWEFRFT